MVDDQCYAAQRSKVEREIWVIPAQRPCPPKLNIARIYTRFGAYRQPVCRTRRIVIIQLVADLGLVGPVRVPLSALVDEDIIRLLCVAFLL